MSGFCCPVCSKPLAKQEKQYLCAKGHSFDLAKSGYVNLLPPASRHSKTPGDNKMMVNARRSFLSSGYYAPLSDCVCRTVIRCLASCVERPAVILDAGCGEGYYTGRLCTALAEQKIPAQILGVDISKTAVDKAAKSVKTARFAVASVFHLPVADQSCDLLLNLFAPYCEEEILRALCPDGSFVMAIPGERHLWELKQAAYDQPYLNEVKDYAIKGLELVKREEIFQTLSLPDQNTIDCLFKMTPYYYKTSQKDQQKLEKLERLDVTMQFELLTYRKKYKNAL
ncbi:MAG: methyltransferase domain-containing protein [Clostridiales bacterium]|nr:methyltransferase domain-containing protein [Clostridiales bacterium]